MSEAINPYAVPRDDETLAEGGETEIDYLEAFIGSNSQYYLDKYMVAQGDPSGKAKVAGFNIAAFFLSLFWMGYRKLYWVAIWFGGFLLVEMTIEFAVLYMLNKEDTPPLWDLGFNLTVAIVLGSFANRWYLAHARREVEAVLASGLRGQVAKEALAKRGGTSFLSALALVLAFFFISIAYGIALALLFYGPEFFTEL